MKTALIVPTIRENSIKDFLQQWKPKDHWDYVIIVEDNPKNTFVIDPFSVNYHVSWEHIESKLGEDAWIISKRDSAIRSFGFLIAKELGADYLFSLDDDCYPIGDPNNYVNGHMTALMGQSRWTASVPGIPTRGYPYYNTGIHTKNILNCGLWAENMDLDAVQSLDAHRRQLNVSVDAEYWSSRSHMIPLHQYFPLCGMNFAFHKDLLPAAYFPLMGQDSPYGRFDDIWFGVISKKICDHIGYTMTCGKPVVRHIRASNVMKNLVKEAPGIALNEVFWELIDGIRLAEQTNIEQAMMLIGSVLEVIPAANIDDTQREYLHRLGKAIQLWVKWTR